MNISRKILIFLILSFVSLFADMTYEGARSVGGAFLEYLEAPALFAGLLGLGELISYVARGITGLIISNYRGSIFLWLTVILGYILNLAVIPALVIAGSWQIAFALLMFERVGKGLRTPSRDVILSEVTEEIGKGRAFGIHEFLDQIGAVTGPLIIAYFLSGHGGYSAGFKFLAIPASISIFLVLTAFILYPRLSSLEISMKIKIREIRGELRDFIILFGLITAAYVPWGIVSYHMVNTGVGSNVVALMYMIAMITDALAAISIGFVYERAKLLIYIAVPPASALATYLLINNGGSIYQYALGATLWGIVTGYFESAFRATISELSVQDYAGGFGAYAVAQAIAFGIGSIFFAVLYSLHPFAAVIYSLAVNSGSAIMLYRMISKH
ncbi:MAG: MFS transporter [Fervidicoccaceae archaeon]